MITFVEFYDNKQLLNQPTALLNQPNSVGTITRAPRRGFKGNEGYSAPDERNLTWPTFKKKKKKKVRINSHA